MTDRGSIEWENVPFKEQVKGLAQRTEQIVNQYEQTIRLQYKKRFEQERDSDWIEYANAEFDRGAVPINFVSRTEPTKIIKVGRLSPGQEMHEEFDHMPENFALPSYYVWSTDYDDRDAPKITPYGVLPGYVVGSEGELYMIVNEYYFNPEGQAVTIQSIAQGDKEDIPKMGEIKKVNFIPAIGNHVAPFKGGDLENINFLLEQIENKSFALEFR